MMRTKTMVSVDSKKLKAEFEKRNLSMAEIAREMGRADKYLSNKIQKDTGEITLADSKFLEAVYSIKREVYELESDASETISEPTPIIDYEKLGQVIYNAVYEAVKKAWSE